MGEKRDMGRYELVRGRYGGTVNQTNFPAGYILPSIVKII